MKKIFIIVLVIISLYFLFNNLFAFFQKGTAEKIPFLIEPEQRVLDLRETSNSFEMKYLRNKAFMITPIAEYKITAIVLSKKNYWYDGDYGIIAPYDLSLAWGALSFKQSYSQIKVRQGYRSTSWTINRDCLLDDYFIQTHLSNVHIIPDNDYIRKQISHLRKYDRVYMEGYLVRYDLFEKNRESYVESSLSREDLGDHACELFLVKYIQWKREKER